MFNNVLLAVALLAVSAFASPTPSGVLEKRDMTCHTTRYTNSQVEACRSTLCDYDVGQGPEGYPHRFGNGEKLNFGSYRGQLYEYPLVLGNTGFSGGSPGPDRCVVAIVSGSDTCDLVGAMTHSGLPAGAPRNGFKLCN